MDIELLKEKCDLRNIKEITFKNTFNDDIKADYIIDADGNNIIPVSILEFKLIEKINELEDRLNELEARLKVLEK